MIVTLLSTSVFANSKTEKLLLKFEKNRVDKSLKRVNGKLNNLKIVLKKDLKQDGWYGYAINLDFTVQGKKLSQKDFLFTNGKLIAPELINIKTKRSFKDMMYPKLSNKYFSKEHLIAGNPNAKHSLVIFSDPLCPICIDEVPSIIKNVIDNPKNIALYYYHMPLDMHPTAKTLSKASMIARDMGIKNVDYRVYQANFNEKYKFDAYEEKSQAKVLGFFNKEFNTNITMNQINNKKLDDKLKYDLKMSEDAFVNGTPTIFFDGEIDKSRSKYEMFLK
jgi:hypothetical protein